jgi:hypothetical protein
LICPSIVPDMVARGRYDGITSSSCDYGVGTADLAALQIWLVKRWMQSADGGFNAETHK